MSNGYLYEENQMARIAPRLRRIIPWSDLPDNTTEQRIAKHNARLKQEAGLAKLDATRGAMSRLGGEALPENGRGSFRGLSQGGSFGQLLANDIKKLESMRRR